MATPFSYLNQNSKGATSGSGASSRLALDNLIRRELRVSDPNNAQEVADALLSRYQGTPQADGIRREAEGLPFLLAPSTPTKMANVETSSDAEMEQAINDVERDLKELTSNSILKDVTPELEGWASAIRSMIAEAFNSARYALDSSQRDKTFGIRRTLGDYARIARLVGALSSPVVNVNYRNLAQSIDEVTAVLLVKMGESLASVSFNRSRYLLQVPFSELQARRDSVINALRNFLGSTQEAYSSNDWVRGVDAYRQFYSFLDAQGQGDLRSLLTENELARILDSLIQRTSQGNIEGLRQVGATAQLELPRLRRLVNLGLNAVSPASPPFEAFLQALQLFIDGLEPSGGFRLLRLARPPILSYGLYGNSTREADPENILVQLALQRNLLAELLDCFLQCGCSPENVKCQIVLDKVLYDLDRTIDLYALGTASNRDPEYRAVAYSYILDVVLEGLSVNPQACQEQDDNNPTNQDHCLPREATSSLVRGIRASLSAARDLLASSVFSSTVLSSSATLNALNSEDPSQDRIRDLVKQELQLQGDMESRWQDLVRTFAPGCIPFQSVDFPDGDGVFDVVDRLVRTALCRALGSNPQDLPIPLRLNPEFNTPEHGEISLQALNRLPIRSSPSIRGE